MLTYEQRIDHLRAQKEEQTQEKLRRNHAYMDEDDYARLLSSSYKQCPYYQSNDEYKIVRHQM